MSAGLSRGARGSSTQSFGPPLVLLGRVDLAARCSRLAFLAVHAPHLYIAPAPQVRSPLQPLMRLR